MYIDIYVYIYIYLYEVTTGGCQAKLHARSGLKAGMGCRCLVLRISCTTFVRLGIQFAHFNLRGLFETALLHIFKCVLKQLSWNKSLQTST